MEMPTLRTEVKNLFLVLFWVIFAAGLFDRFPLPGFAARSFLIALALVVTVSAFGFGAALVNRAYPEDGMPLEYVLFSTIAGFGVLSLVMFAAGAAALWTRGGAIGVVSLGLFLAWSRRRSLARLAGSNVKGHLAAAPLFLLIVSGAISLTLAFTPVTYYDSLVYHMALPQSYIQAGRWVGEPQLIYSAFPQGMEMIWTLGLLLANDVLASLLGWVLSALCVLAVYSFGKRYLGQATGLWAAALLSVMPAYLLLSSGGYVDLGLAAFSFMSFYALCLWKDHQQTPLLMLSGAFAGFALSTKYTAAIPLGIGLVLFIKEAHPRSLINISKQAILYLIPSIIIFLPWLLKNLHYVGNPVFPFFYSWTLKAKNPWMDAAAAGYFLRGLSEYSPRPIWYLFELLWDVGVHGLNFGGGMDVLGDLGWAPLIAFLPAIWLAKRESSVLKLVLLYSLLFFAIWGMTRPVLRFLLPLAPFLALASAFGYEEGIKKKPQGLRAAAGLLMILLLLSNAKLFFEVTDLLASFRVPLGLESREEYLSKTLDYYQTATYINSLPTDTVVYVVGDQRAYYYNRPVLMAPVFNTNPLTEWANSASSAQTLAASLQARHITHLLINHSELARLDSVYHLFPFTAKGQANWNALCSRIAKPVYRDKHCEVLALPSGEAS